ncbi:MAG: hypothetical protein KJZ69_09835 [Phycisphaerales bacterium]|nr:hypothetical protein [Phycisphaerales bacterium]
MMRQRIMATAAAACVAFAGCAEQRGGSDAAQEKPIAPVSEADAAQAGAGEPGGLSGPEAAPAHEARPAAWPFRPASIRIHPLTHALRQEGAVSVIEAHVEFLDRYGHTTKGVGLVRLELFAADALPGSARLGTWEIDLNDLDANSRHYDDVTRTYRLRLGLDGLANPPDTARLGATVVLPNQRLTATLVLDLR